MRLHRRWMYGWCAMSVMMLAASCSGGQEETSGDEGGVHTVLPDEETRVTVQVLQLQDFEHELVSNGKLEAGQQADLKFETQGVVAAVYVKNGEVVRKGQKLAELDKFTLTRKTAQARDRHGASPPGDAGRADRAGLRGGRLDRGTGGRDAPGTGEERL